MSEEINICPDRFGLENTRCITAACAMWYKPENRCGKLQRVYVEAEREYRGNNEREDLISLQTWKRILTPLIEALNKMVGGR